MYGFPLVLAYWSLPFVALLVGVFSRHQRLARLRLPVPCLASRPGYEALSQTRQEDRCEQRPRSIALVNGLVLAVAMYAALRTLTGDAITVHDLGVATGVGIAAGVGGLMLLALVRSALSLRRAARRLTEHGMVGIWSPPCRRSLSRRGFDRSLAFLEEFLGWIRLPGISTAATPPHDFGTAVRQTVSESRVLCAISADGLDVLELLAGDPDRLEAGPEPLLRGIRVRLLLVPPRSGRVDPGRKRLSTAEVSLAMIDRSPEDHWRHLRASLVLQEEWQERHGVQMEVRFLESRPAFACLLSGERVWVHPWANRDGTWLELAAGPDVRLLGDGLTDYFANEWATATEELDVPLSDGATGSTVIRKGIDVPEHFQRA